MGVPRVDTTVPGKDTPENRGDDRNMDGDGKNAPQEALADIDVQQQIEDRRKQAIDHRIAEKAIHAAYYLGCGYINIQRSTGGDRETLRTYNDPDAGAGLTIVCQMVRIDDGAEVESLEILEGEEAVFLQKSGIIEGYIPGDWEAELEKLQRPADRARETMAKVGERKQQAEESERGDALRKAWGLSAGDDRVRGTDPPKPRVAGVMEQPPRKRKR